MKILVISPSWIGDTIISHSLYRLLYKKYSPNIIQIDAIVSEPCQSIIHRMPEINKSFTIPYKHRILEFRKYFNLGYFLKKNKYQQVIILPNSLKSAIAPYLANIPIRTGWKGEMRYGLLNDLRILNKSSFPLMIQRYAALAYNQKEIQHFSDFPDPFPLPKLYVQEKEIHNILLKFNLNKSTKKFIGLCPGSASHVFKRWPHYHYIELATRLIFYGYHVIILGSIQDQLIKQFFKQSALKYFKQNYHDLIGCTSLDEAAIILAACTIIVSNDSGLMHIACALKRPVIGLYGPYNPPTLAPPLFYKSKIIYYQDNKDSQKNSKKFDLYGYHNNLIKISPNKVFNIIQQMLLN